MVQQMEVHGDQVILGHSGALVASKSQPGAWHVVKGTTCDCPGFAYRGTCRHVTAAILARVPTPATHPNLFLPERSRLA